MPRPWPALVLDRGHRAGDRRSKTIDLAWVSSRGWQAPGLPSDQVELVVLGVSERGVADRGELDLAEQLGAQAGQPRGLLVVVLGDQDGAEPVPGRPGRGGLVEDQPGTARRAGVPGPLASPSAVP